MLSEIEQYIELAKTTVPKDPYIAGLPFVSKTLILMLKNEALIVSHPEKKADTRLRLGLEVNSNALFGVELVTSGKRERLARCGFEFDLHKNCFDIVHTPQGRHVNFMTKEAQRIFNGIRDFRELMLQDTLTLACSLGISQVTAIGSRNHFKVKEGTITAQRGFDIIDAPLTAVGFIEDQVGNFYYDIK